MAGLLVTGFDAFAGLPFNPSEAIVRRLASDPPPGLSEALLLPTSYDEASDKVRAGLERVRPDGVLMFGLARATAGLRLERYAHNRIEASIADNSGVVGKGRTIVTGGPAALETTTDLAAVLAGVTEAGLRAFVSLDAGGYVCNHVYYTVLHWLAENRPGTPALFVHVPWVHEPATAEDFQVRPVDLHERAARLVVALVQAGAPAS
ncbi:pyroglutamyl-peptidase I [Chthonobacter albigriseus]|uniref:pyroglutamyl-peptidase I n=1 Tax=Chthonobacter albigriseus TaxID=1683161 RepID=UPI0015EFC765|nr:pyroglutamyl-peptidase I [Chthonobacter albigriseus]